MTADTPWSRIPKCLVAFGFWSIIAIVIATLSHTRMLAVERPSEYTKWLIESLLIWNFWTLATFPVLWLGKRLYLGSAHRLRNIALLLGVGIVFGLVFLTYQVTISIWIMGESFDRYWLQVTGQFAWFGPYSLLIFGGLVTLGNAQEYRHRWQQQEIAVRELETQLTRAQLDVLKSQLQPHFFFNTLNSISVLIRKGEPDLAQTTLGQLSDLLRYTLSIGSRQTVPLAEELAFVRGYLKIEQTRFGERLTVSISADADCLSIQIPPLMIQPIAENAIRHGLADKVDSGTIRISITRNSSTLTCAVEDNGVGYRHDNSSAGQPREGLGLGNTRARLERLFGDKYSLAITPGESAGARVTITIPIEPSMETGP